MNESYLVTAKEDKRNANLLCINKKTADGEIENLSNENLIRIVKWWNHKWEDEEEDDEVYESKNKEELIKLVKDVRNDIIKKGSTKLVS